MTHNMHMPPPPLVLRTGLSPLLTCCPACVPPPCPPRACSTCRTASGAKLLASSGAGPRAGAAHHIFVHVKPSSLCRAAARQKLSSVSDLRAKQRHACGGGAHDRWPFQSLRWHRRLQYGVPHAHAQNDSSPQPSHLQRSEPSAAGLGGRANSARRSLTRTDAACPRESTRRCRSLIRTWHAMRNSTI
jgi:hypothetical protein